MINLVDSDAHGVVVTVTDADLRHLCPHVDEVDRGTVSISWRVITKTIELHSLRRYLDTFAEAKIAHEDLTRQIREDLTLSGIVLLNVSTRFDTARMNVAVTTGAR